MKGDKKSTAPYVALARVYDEVMEHVDYWAWSIYLADLMEEFTSPPKTILELACGTGSLAISLTNLLDVSYRAFDVSSEMITVANSKKSDGDDIEFYVADYLTFTCNEPSDVIILVYDGLNYLTQEEGVLKLFENVQTCMHDGSVFIFDVSTPANSIKNAASFEDYGKGDDFSYYRTSRYDSDSMLHRTVFELDFGSESYSEEHIQRAYSIDTIKKLIQQSGMEIVAAVENFTFEEVSDDSERVHVVARRAR